MESNLFPNLSIVLVETSHPGNVGAAARAMKNMGVTELTLVKPKEFPSEKAKARAVSAADVLENARVVNSVEEAIADCQLVIGTSARDRRIPWLMLDPKGCGAKVVATNEELQQCHFHVNIPTGEAYSSLNLSMAVQVICYELLQAKQVPVTDQRWDIDYANAGDMEHMYKHLEETMIQVGFHDPETPRQLLSRVRRLFNRIRPDQMEINILRGFLTAVNRLSK
jgi:tRNA (cytidine32/uridine32-2'-O)-methyltransferase